MKLLVKNLDAVEWLTTADGGDVDLQEVADRVNSYDALVDDANHLAHILEWLLTGEQRFEYLRWKGMIKEAHRAIAAHKALILTNA